MALDKSKIDYSVYLVTGKELLPPGVDYYDSLDRCLKDGNVTVVQIREKDVDTNEFLEIAQNSLKICDKYNVPMLINDNLTVAISLPERVGLHIGQEDIPVAQARRLFGPNRLLGISVKTVEQAKAAKRSGADYAGVGACFGTRSKAGITADKIIGPRGARDIIEVLGPKEDDIRMPCVLIGGLNQKTAARTLFGATSASNSPDGIAVISAIVSRVDSDVAAAELHTIVSDFKTALSASIQHCTASPTLASRSHFGVDVAFTTPHLHNTSEKYFIDGVEQLFKSHRQSDLGPPLIQTITSHVSSTMSANIALAFSSSPIMSHESEEAEELSKAIGALVLNIGTIGPASRAGMKVAGNAANLGKKPIVLDPVGVGATHFRKEVVKEIMNHTQITLLKGNAAELAAIAGSTEVQARGVDSGSGTLKDPVSLVKSLAQRERCLVLLTGKIDYLTDGHRVIASENGHPLLGSITGSGCALGVTVAAGLAALCNYAKIHTQTSFSLSSSPALGNVLVNCNCRQQDLLIGALTGLLSMTIASEKAAARPDVQGPGTFIPALIDQLASLTPQDIVKLAKIKVIH